MKFSEKYYKDLNLSPYQHFINNVWFIETLDKLKDTGTLFIPDINKTFNKLPSYWSAIFSKFLSIIKDSCLNTLTINDIATITVFCNIT